MLLLTIREVASVLRVPVSRVYSLARRGVIPTVRLGDRQLRVDQEALRDWVQRGGQPRHAHQPSNRIPTAGKSNFRSCVKN